MAAGVHNFVLEQGATFRRQITVTVGDPALALDLTGYSARMQIRKALADVSPVLSLTDDTDDGLTLGGSAGTIDILITAEQSDALPLTTTSGVYDLELAAPGGDVTRLLKGTFTFDQEVTR